MSEDPTIYTCELLKSAGINGTIYSFFGQNMDEENDLTVYMKVLYGDGSKYG